MKIYSTYYIYVLLIPYKRSNSHERSKKSGRKKSLRKMFLSEHFRNNGTFPFRGCTMMNTLVSGIGIGVEVTEQFVVHVNSLPGRKLRTTAILGAAVTRKTGQRDPDLFLKLRICSNAAG